MSDLNLNFDNGLKNITMGNSSSGNIQVLSEGENSDTHDGVEPRYTSPNLAVSDPAGIEFLAKGINSPPGGNTPNSTRSEDFNFFKPQVEPAGIVDGNMPANMPANDTDDMLINPSVQSSQEQEFKPIHRLTPQDIKNEKIDLLYKFKKLESQGIRTTMNYNMNSHLEDMRNEFVKLKKQREIDNSVKFQRKMLMACVTGLEFMNGRFDPFNVKLDGWGESVNENLNDYDEIFEELTEKYGGGGDMAPELRLMFTLAGSAFMFHLSNTMFKSSIPGMDDVLQQNPELMKQFAEAAVGSMNRGQQPQQQQQQQQQQQRAPVNPLAAMMGMSGGGGDNPLSGLMGGLMGGIMGQPPQQQQQQQQQQRQMRPTSPARSDMSGPDGIDDLINKMNLQPDQIPDLDSISLMSGDTDRKSTDRGITLNL